MAKMDPCCARFEGRRTRNAAELGRLARLMARRPTAATQAKIVALKLEVETTKRLAEEHDATHAGAVA